MTIKTMGKRAFGFLLTEGPGSISRDEGELALNQSVQPGELLAILAKTSAVTVNVAARAGNTGNGVLTLASPAYTAKLKPGNYAAVCITAVANGGVFRLERDGQEVETKAVGANFVKEAKFAIADGSVDFAVGDAFDFFVDFGEGDDGGEQYVAFDPTATNGAEVPKAVNCLMATTDGSTTRRIVTIRRIAEVMGDYIAWPPGITDAQKHKAVRDLADDYVIVR